MRLSASGTPDSCACAFLFHRGHVVAPRARMFDPDEIARAAHAQYARLNFKPPPQQFTVLAAFVLQDTVNADALKVVSLGTGSKCLPGARLQHGGDALHDSHAEVLARRGAVRWLLEEVERMCGGVEESRWIEEIVHERRKFRLRPTVRVWLYVSTLPCGDASTRHLASSQDPSIAALKNSTAFPALPAGGAARGRDNYALYGVLRTKPGRVDSPPTRCMSCSDKIASWGVLGIQGALAGRVLEPVYVDGVVVGEVDVSMRDVVAEECGRAFWGRLEGMDEARLPSGYSLKRPDVFFTSVPFVHSRTALGGLDASSCNDSLCYIADSPKQYEVLINGLRRGVPPKHRNNPKFRPILSKIALFGLYLRTCDALHLDIDRSITYRGAKDDSQDYQTAKNALRGEDGPFRGWVRSGPQWEQFGVDGVTQEANRNEIG